MKYRLELGDFVLDEDTHQTGEVVVTESDAVYVQFPGRYHLMEYSRDDDALIVVGREKRKSLFERFTALFKPNPLKRK